ncbi:MAG: aminoglycoside phosphotransferase family protein [Chloroflexota bacterium]|nr:aminoglycoside phosphotransferase family protein [Chloroflexota bacterium]
MIVPTLSHLDTLRDPEQMREIFQRYLLSDTNPAVVIDSCAVDFVRQASNRSLFQYTLHLREPGTGSLRRQVVTGVTYDADRGRRILGRVRQSDPGVMMPVGPALPAVAYVPELQLLVQVFPYDHRLPALAQILKEPPPELASVLLGEFGAGDWRIETWEAETLRYRVDMRAMVRLDMQAREAVGGRAAERRVYAKIYRDAEEGERASAMQRALWERTSASGAEFAVARPVAYLDELRTLLLDEVTGIRFLNIIRREDETLLVVRRVARAMAALHRLPVDDVFASRGRPPRDELARLETAAERLQTAAPELRHAVAEIASVIAASFADVPTAPTHFDLKPAHIMLDGDHVSLLDFDKLVAADPMVDVTTLLTHFRKERRQRLHRHGRMDPTARMFAEEYFTHVPAAWYARFPACQAMALLLEAVSPPSGLRGRDGKADTLDRIPALVREAHEVAMGNLL